MQNEINILGTKYFISIESDEENPQLKKCDGYMDWTINKIVVAKFENDEDSVSNLEEFTKKVLRHEIIHAFIRESGLWENSNEVKAWAQCEEMTDWIAIQFHKIESVFNELGI